MSKIFLIGDTHIGLGFPNKTEKWLSVHKEYFNDFLIPFLRENSKEGDIVVHLGDLFDNRNVIPINLLNYGMDVVEEISKILPLHIIIGNHDCWSKSADEINTIRPFRYIPNVNVYDKVTRVDYNGVKLLFMPYFEKRMEQIRHIDENKDCDYLFCHSDLNGARMHLTSVGHRNADKIDVEEFKVFKGVYSGHIHIVDRHKNFTFVGSNFQMDRNDFNDQKGIFVVDIETGKEEFIKNTISPIFKKVKVLVESDIEALEELKDSKDYIDISISNTLLISNRKLRRKLEIILEKSSFASVEYIDDVSLIKESDDVEEEVILDEETLDISIQLDYEDYVKEYITKQKYDNDKFKSEVITEYDNIIKIYKENYTNKN